MKEKLILGVLIMAVILSSSFLVLALVNNSTSVNSSREGKIELGEVSVIINSDDDEIEIDDDLTEEDESEIPISGNALERAGVVALEYIGEGKVTDTEIDDEEGYYEIEITLDDGGEVDVHLDENFRVLSKEYDSNDEDED